VVRLDEDEVPIMLHRERTYSFSHTKGSSKVIETLCARVVAVILEGSLKAVDNLA
jgi:hypothetical protein